MASGRDIEKGQVDESDSVIVERGGKTVEEWKRNLDIKLWKAGSPLPSTCCIFKVPNVLRRQEEQAFEPDIVSIGPFHRGGKKFQLVENVKEWYLKNLLKRRTTLSLDSLIEGIRGLEERARGCYSDPCNHLNQNDFIEMLILDGCFLIELFRKTASPDTRVDNDDPIFNLSCILEYLYHDLLLLENQLPWFVLEPIYNLIESDSPKLPLSQVVIDFFKDSVAEPKIFSSHVPTPTTEILHILDLIRTSLVQEYKVDYQEHEDLMEAPTSGFANHLPQRIPGVTTLLEAGVKFEMGPPGCIMNITFEGGVFTIPPLAIDERTGPMFRNLMAYEQCYHSCALKITAYTVLMDNLIDTNEDVDLLCKTSILANWFKNGDASKFFYDLHTDTIVMDFVYKKLCYEVHRYRLGPWRPPWSIWKMKLRRDYFDTPWSAISFFAAFVLMVLTFLQTIYTVQPYYHPAPE